MRRQIAENACGLQRSVAGTLVRFRADQGLIRVEHAFGHSTAPDFAEHPEKVAAQNASYIRGGEPPGF